jgi:hypothetical protein
VVTDGERPSENLWAIDFGAINESEKSMFMIVRSTPNGSGADFPEQGTSSDSPSLHKEGVSMYMQVITSRIEATKYASHILEQPESYQEYRIGGAACSVCKSPEDAKTVDEKIQFRDGFQNRKTTDPGILRYTRIQMLKQNQELKKRWKKRSRRS